MPRRPRPARTPDALVLPLLLAGACLAPEGRLAAQEPVPAGPVRVFLDCQTFGCDRDFIRTELDWVSWVRDREVADVHLLVTSQGAGGGGRRYTLDFLGRGPFQGDDVQLVHPTSGNATDDEVRRGLVDRMGAGLLRYAALTEAGRGLVVRRPGGEAGEASEPAGPVDDPWDFWVFELSVDASLDGESRQSSVEMEGEVNANRTTEAWKLNAEADYRREEEDIELEDRTVESLREDWSVEAFAVRSVADHWAVGTRLETGRDTRFNQDLRAAAFVGVEYSLFPYDQFTRRSLTAQYLLGVSHFDWDRETLYGETAETRPNESLTLALDLVQPWGEADVGLTGSHYLHDLARWRLELDGRVEVRVVQGFSVFARGEYQWIRDQLHLPVEGLTDDEVLLELQQLATDFSYETSFGVSYRFGSIFNNVVNPRFGN